MSIIPKFVKREAMPLGPCWALRHGLVMHSCYHDMDKAIFMYVLRNGSLIFGQKDRPCIA